jgi:high frequency lysogenization protein
MPGAAVKDRVLALAGLLQSVRLVQEMANNGQVQTGALAPCIESLFRFDADSTEDVYGGVRALVPGLRRVVAQLDGSDRDGAQTRMAMNVLHLERRFAAHPAAMDAVQERLEEVQREQQPWEPTHPAVLARLGAVYAELVSPLGPKVMVAGNPVYLSQPEVVAEVRAALLAALRSAVLWRQLGGSWWDLLVSRRRMVEIAQELSKGG